MTIKNRLETIQIYYRIRDYTEIGKELDPLSEEQYLIGKLIEVLRNSDQENKEVLTNIINILCGEKCGYKKAGKKDVRILPQDSESDEKYSVDRLMKDCQYLRKD